MNPQIPESFWQYLAIGAVGLVVALVAWYAKNTHADLKELQSEHKKLNDLVLTNYHAKPEIGAALDEIKDSIKDLHKRFDHFFVKGT